MIEVTDEEFKRLSASGVLITNRSGETFLIIGEETIRRSPTQAEYEKEKSSI